MKEAFFLGIRSWLCDIRLVERLGPLPPDIQAEDNIVENNENNRAQKYPLQRGQVLIQVQLIYPLPFVTTMNKNNKIPVPNPFLNAVS